MKRILALLLSLTPLVLWPAAMPFSGPITFQQMQTVFGGSNPVGFNEYYRSGGLVNSNATTLTIPTSGQISMSQFYAGSNAGPGLTGGSLIAGNAAGTVGFSTNWATCAGNIYGSMIPNTTDDGKGLVCLYNDGSTNLILVITGFPSNPGQTGWAVTLAITGGATLNFSSATAFSYASGGAKWTWALSPRFITGAGYTITIN